MSKISEELIQITGENNIIVACIRYSDMPLTVPEMAKILGSWVTEKSVWKLVDESIEKNLIEQWGTVECNRSHSLQMAFQIKE